MKRAVFCAGLCAACWTAPAAADARWRGAWTHVVDDGHVVDGQGADAAPREPRSNVIELARSAQPRTWVVARHRYDILDLPAVNAQAAATNGHVHRLSAGFEWSDDRTRVLVEPTLAVSSNVGRHPGAVRASDVQPVVAFERRVADAGRGTSLRAGIHADARLGRFIAYPTVHWGTDDNGRSGWQVGFPDSRWRRAVGSEASIELSVSPDGGQWQVRDRELQQRSRVRRQLWRAAAAVRWHASDAVSVGWFAGRTFAGELRYQLVDGTPARLDLPGASFAGVNVQGRW